MSQAFDILVIGSGPGGYRAAVLAALRGRKVAIVEKAQWGGCCLNRGCVPKKDWHHTANLVAAARHFAGRGIAGGPLSGDLAQAWHHQRKVVTTVRDSYIDYMKRLGISAYTGAARFVDAHTVAITGPDGEVPVTAGHIVIATGSTPHIPDGLQVVAGKVLTTDMLFDVEPPPGRRVAVVGGGVIGAEFAYILKLLGREVEWLVSRTPLARARFSAQALSTLKAALKAHGVAARQGVRVQGASVGADGVTIKLSDGQTLDVDWLLLGSGRVPYTDGLALTAAGVTLDAAGFIATNSHLATSVPHIYAIGDCVSEHMTANQAIADATLAVENILDGNRRVRDPLWVPEVVYSAVELACAGMNEDMAEDQGLEPAVGFAAFETSPKALGQDDTRGFVRLIGELDSGRLLGGEVVGAEAGELVHLLTLAPDPATALRWLASGRYNHPARSEEFINATETLATKWGLAGHIFGGGADD